MFKKIDFIKRRKHILKKMDNNSIMIIKANPILYKNGDTEFLHKQDSNFYYLTGINESDCTLILTKIANKTKEYFFTKKNDKHIEIWVGKRKEIDELKDITGIERILYNKQIDDCIKAFIRSASLLYYDSKSYGCNKFNRKTLEINELKKQYPGICCVKNINNVLDLRIVKSNNEIKCIEKAIDITRDAVIRAYKYSKPGIFEYEIRAEIEYAFGKRGTAIPGFPTIVAAGKNATILHYVSLDKKVKKDELVLIDIGADYMNYSADISRTYPASGKFIGRQKNLYSALLDIQKKLIDYVKPGISMIKIYKQTGTLIGKMLKTFKYIKNESDYIKYYPHGVGHMLGLDTHDTYGTYTNKSPLKKGMVITIEPGVYIKEHNIGIRIEDDILVTDKGRKNLSQSIPKDIKDIEKIMGA
ncbi:aminopeptidase P family protein [candidate division WOR-3 bacterium]|nr:aminopeptidase P family protein [candidate division WOR-3 bacterium]